MLEGFEGRGRKGLKIDCIFCLGLELGVIRVNFVFCFVNIFFLGLYYENVCLIGKIYC